MWAYNDVHKDVVKLFLHHSERIELNARGNNGETAFMIACEFGHKEVVQLLLENSNIDLKARDNHGWTAFINACSRGHKDVVKLLLDHSERFDLNAKDNNGRTALMIASQKSIVKLIKAKLHQIEAPQKTVHQIMTRQRTKMIKAKLSQ